MIIDLPKSFIYTDKASLYSVYISKDKLYIEGNVDYEDMMYTLAYVLRDYKRCCYCGKILAHKERTLDHRFPRAWGRSWYHKQPFSNLFCVQ